MAVSVLIRSEILARDRWGHADCTAIRISNWPAIVASGNLAGSLLVSQGPATYVNAYAVKMTE